MRVYVAGPYTQGDGNILNMRRAVQVACHVISAGHDPFVPHLNGLIDFFQPHDYETYMRIDTAWIPVSHCLLVLPGFSPGARREVALAHVCGIPVLNVEDITEFEIHELLRSVEC